MFGEKHPETVKDEAEKWRDGKILSIAGWAKVKRKTESRNVLELQFRLACELGALEGENTFFPESFNNPC